MIATLARLLHFRRRRARVREIAREIEVRLAIRKSRRIERAASARRGWDTRRGRG